MHECTFTPYHDVMTIINDATVCVTLSEDTSLTRDMTLVRMKTVCAVFSLTVRIRTHKRSYNDNETPQDENG